LALIPGLIKKLSSFVPLLLFVLGCHHTPSPTGIDALPDSDLLGVFSYDSQRDSATITASTKSYTTTGAAAKYLSIGQTSEYTCSALLRWIDLPGDINMGGRIVSATLTLYPTKYGIGDLAAPFAFNVREITSSWSSHSLTADSLRAGKIVTKPGIAGSFSGVIGDSVVIALDTAMIRNWLSIASMGNENLGNIRGMFLEPATGSNAIRAFESSDPRSVYDVVLNSKTPKLTIVVDKSSVQDTIRPTTIEDTYLAVTHTPVPTGLVVAGGTTLRGALRFDVSRIPAGSIINHVSLRLTIDDAACRRTYTGIDSVYVFESLSGEKDSTASYSIVTQKGDSGRWVAEGGTTLPLVRAVQHWVNDPLSNHGLILIKPEESSDLDRYVFFGADAIAPEKRPRLYVSYSQRP
jgi:hypothetical protein